MPFDAVFDQIFRIWVPIAGAVFGIVVAVLVVALIRNRSGRRKNLPFRAHKNTPVELTYAIVLALIVGGLVYGSFWANGKLNNGVGLAEAEATEPVARVNVSAYRWCWKFGYEASPKTETAQCESHDFPTVVVPAGKPVEFNISSRDVIHSFWLPDFDVKRDAFPDHLNTLRMVFPEEGTFEGRCAEYCGTHHVSMHFYVKVVSPAEYQQYLAGGAA